MANLSTVYMGLKLRNPLIVGSSGLTNSIEDIKACEQWGAGAVVLKSVFEEQLLAETRKEINSAEMSMHAEAYNYIAGVTRERNIDLYVDLIEKAKKETSIPVIASVNCVSDGGWTELTERFEQAGADALELNIFILDLNPKDTSEIIEEKYVSIIRSTLKHINIPVAIKVGPDRKSVV